MNGRAIAAASVGALCGYLSGYVIGHTRTNFAVVGSGGRASWFGSGPALSAVAAALVAVVVVVVLSRLRARYLVVVAVGIAGLAMVVAVAATQAAGTSSVQSILGGVGAGLLIATAVIRPEAQRWFVIGAMIAVLYGFRIDQSVEIPRRYGDYLSTRTVPDLPDSWPLLVAAVLALLAAGFVIGQERVEPVPSRRALAVGAGVPLGAGALVLAVGELPGNPSVTVAIVAVVGLAALGWWLPRPDGVYVLAMLAVAAVIAVDPSVGDGPDRVGVSVQIGLMVLGAFVGAMYRAPMVGIVLCAMVTVSGLAPALLDSDTVTEFAFRFAAPTAIGFVVGASLPAASATVIGLSVVPVLAHSFERRILMADHGDPEFGWLAMEADTYTVAPGPESAFLAATVTVLGCAAMVRWRRQPVADPHVDAEARWRQRSG
ncbi:hypothetical protein [Nocardia mangyaensis]|uniref:hypothetical protein n=1 Tax=Nocardia mangyaensis TaxID=2213200 RepID=UPI002674CEF3|nr:hypothetical protein [Nocardia mangyaensis]MDO3649926.1 hypothetical protein [Nocardia mangyaensis]